MTAHANLIGTGMFTRDYQKRWKAANPDKIREAERKWLHANRAKNRAQQKLRYALRKGRLVRQPCQVCGDHKSEAHHDDYSKPLDVRWLCHQHHFQQHSMTPIATTPVKEFLRKIGSKGGKKSAMHPDRRRLNKEAAEARWRQRHPEPKEVEK